MIWVEFALGAMFLGYCILGKRVEKFFNMGEK